MRKILVAVIALCISLTTSFAQKGYLRGKVLDGENGEALFGATIVQQGTTNGTVADFDGNYSLPLEEGIYTIVYQSVSYKTKVVQEVNIAAEDVTTLDVNMTPDVEQLEEIVVVAEVLRDSEAGILNVQKKSPNVMDGISSQAFRKIGDSDLSGAMKRVTGVSVQGGKYVYVRGLGDRYTRTTLNGLSIPGLDPERNDVQIDMFPTSVLENVMVYKTFTPELSGDFSGGTVNVETKNFPEEKFTRIAFALGFNPNMNLVNDYATYSGGSLDFLGFDDGTRAMPISPTEDVPSPDAEPEDQFRLERLTRSLNPEMAVKTKRNFLNTGFLFNHGNQIDKGKYKIGYGVVFNYQNKYEYYPHTELNFYFKDTDRDVNGLDPQVKKTGILGRNNVLWSGLITSAIKFDKHEFGISLLRTQNGQSDAAKRISKDLEETSQTAHEDILTYTQRSITSPAIYGKHKFNNLLLNWSNSYTIARVYDPDFRATTIAETGTQEEPDYSIDGGDGGGVRRFWRELNEDNENFKVDLTYEISSKNKLKFGGAGLLKWRDFTTYAFQLRNRLPIENDPDYLLQPENIWTPNTKVGTYLAGDYEPANNYEAQSSVYAGYVMNDAYLGDKFRAIYGVRVEQTQMYYTGQNNFGTIVYDNQKTMDELNWLPSVNLVYSPTDNMNIRGSYGKTLARPSFREKSIAQILDPITGIRYNGNIDLNQTTIDNFDLRLENFFGMNEMVAISAYYKKFQGPIEQVRYQVAYSEVTWQNAGESQVYGLEFELRKNLDFLARGLSFGTNISWTRSFVDMSKIIVDEPSGTTELESRQEQARTGETIDRYRDMQGQAPYLINGYLNYSDNEQVNNINLSYNVQGESISIVGVAQTPDVYVKPFNSLNLTASRKFGEKQHSQLIFRVENILGDIKEEVWKNYKAPEEIFATFDPGRTFTLRYSYTF